jgi:hypothetical protein
MYVRNCICFDVKNSLSKLVQVSSLQTLCGLNLSLALRFIDSKNALSWVVKLLNPRCTQAYCKMLFNAPTTDCKTCVRIVSTRRLQWKLDVGTWQHSKKFIILKCVREARLHKLRQLICSAELFKELCKEEWITDWPFKSRIRSRPAANSLAAPYSDQIWVMAKCERGLLLSCIPYWPLNRPDPLCCRLVDWDSYLCSANTNLRTGFPITYRISL